jgi:pSer/pThr/pTyr-binding forkhead associated (FHA) protein
MSDRLRRAEPAEPTNVPTLVCLTGEAPKQLALSKKSITIGRGHQCDIQILTHFVSREHARITTDHGTVIIEDLASTNGVFVNSIRVDRHELRHGDLLTIGETQFRFLESVAH